MSPKYATGSAAFLILALSICVPVHWPASPGTARADEFSGPERDRWQMPNEILASLDLKTGDVVADIGAGIGYFTMRFAQAVGPGGKVYAVDIAPHVLEYLQKEARKQKLNNVETLVSREDDPLLPAASVDLAFFCDTAHEIGGRVNFYRKVRQALKRNGRMVVIDSISAARKGAPSLQSEGQVSRDVAVREAEQAGFRLVKEPKFLPRQYFLVFERARDTLNRRR